MPAKSKAASLLVIFALATSAAAAENNWDNVGQALGKSGTVMGDVYRVGFPRSDLKVTVDGVSIKPGFALGGWLAFEATGIMPW